MFKLTFLVLISYAVVFTIIDPTAGGDPLPRHSVNRPNAESGQLLTAEKLIETMLINDAENYIQDGECNLSKGCNPELCCKSGQNCGYEDGLFYCYYP